MQRAHRRVISELAAGLLAFCTVLWLVIPRWVGPAAPAAPSVSECPQGRYVTIHDGGRLGNKLCQYASLWALQRDEAGARPAWVQPELRRTLAPLFSGLSLPVLPEACVLHRSIWNLWNFRNWSFWEVSYHNFFTADLGPADRPLLLAQNPCDLRRFNRHRQALFRQLKFWDDVREEAQHRLRQLTETHCRGTPGCTFVAVHVRRTDYASQVRLMYNGTLVGEKYLARALALCRRRYRRPVFVVCSDDLAWVRRRLRGPDVVIAGSPGDDSAGRDMALMAQCNHTVVTHGTFGYMSAYLAQGDVVMPTGFGRRDAFLSEEMRRSGLNLTALPAF